MRRLALLLAASVLGTGCIVTDNDCARSLSMTWDFVDATDTLRATCSQAGINFVDVFVDSNPGVRFSCLNATGGSVPLSGGAHTVTIEGVSAASVSDSGIIVYRDQVNVTAVCGDQFVDTHPSEQDIQLAYTFEAGNNACAANPSYIWFSIVDDLTHAEVAYVGRDAAFADQIRYTCQADNAIFPLPAGTYHLRWIEEVTAPGGAFGVVRTNCSGAAFGVVGEYLGNGTVGVPVQLLPSTTSCEP